MKSLFFNRWFPICYLPGGNLLSYKYGSLAIINLENNEVVKKRKILTLFKETVLAKVPPIFRFLRLGARKGIYIGNNTALVVIGKTIYEVNTDTLEFSSGYTNGISRPLKFALSDGVEGFDDGVYWGDYFGNSQKGEVSIYKRTGEDKWQTVFTFDKGEITHIHNVVPDKYHNCFWILTGDFDKESAIWKATNNFKEVTPFLRGNQDYRGCVAFPVPDGLIYATDAPFQDDYIMKLKLDGENVELKKLQPINGSCIYGAQTSDGRLVFASTVEADGRNQSLMKFLFGKKRGAGIKDEYAYVYLGTPDNGFKTVYKAKKDWLPFSFQFGTFMFPEGVGGNNKLAFYPVAVNNGQLGTKIINI